MIRIHFIIHEEYEGPGAFKQWAIKRGYKYSFSRVYLYENLPQNIDDIDLLIVLGGPQRPNTTKDDCPHFDSHKEIEVIRQFILKEKAVLGVCLGAQLVGEALGAGFEESPFKEIGVFKISKTTAGKSNEKFSQFPASVVVGHWHGDMPGLTGSAKIIARSEGCPRQIIEYSKLVYGFQCHLELLPEQIELLIYNSENELLSGGKYTQSARDLRKYDYKEMNELLFTFMDKLIQQYTQT